MRMPRANPSRLSATANGSRLPSSMKNKRSRCCALVVCHLVLARTRFSQAFLGPILSPPPGGCAKRWRTACLARTQRSGTLSGTSSRKRGGGALLAATGSDEKSGGGYSSSSSGATDDPKRMTRAPLRITPNFMPQEKRRPKTTRMNRDDALYGAFLAEESLDIAVIAWAEFTDWLRRTIERNVNGAQFEFDIRQWSSSIRKWWSRAVEMDVQAKAELLRLYDRGMLDRDSWGPQAVKVDASVEDEWDSIYVECQDCLESADASVESIDTVTTARDRDFPLASAPMTYSGVRNGAARSLTSPAVVPSVNLYDGEEWDEGDWDEGEWDDEENQDGEEGQGITEEDIIDCAIRGRWTFDNNDDPVWWHHTFTGSAGVNFETFAEF